jgi:hypothetical protein
VTRGLALTNVVLQALLFGAASVGVWLAARRRFTWHCWVMRSAVVGQLLLVAFIMAPSLSAYVGHWSGWSVFTAELVIHHSLGAIVVLLFIYFNLALGGIVPSPRRLRPYMRAALVLWAVALALGLYLFWYIWR